MLPNKFHPDSTSKSGSASSHHCEHFNLLQLDSSSPPEIRHITPLISKCNSPSRLWCNTWASGKHVMGIFLLTDVHFAITVVSNHHYEHHDHHRLDNNGQWQPELETHLCLEPQVCFLFFANMLTYAQGVARHNTSNQLQVHMQRLRRQPFWASQVSFLSTISLLTIIYKQTMHTEWNGNPNDTRGSWGIAITGTTTTTKVGPRWWQRQQWWPVSPRNDANRGTNEETSDGTKWYHLLVPLIIFFFSFNFRTLIMFLWAGLQYNLHPEAHQQPQHRWHQADKADTTVMTPWCHMSRGQWEVPKQLPWQPGW